MMSEKNNSSTGLDVDREDQPLPRQIPPRTLWSKQTPPLTQGELSLAEKLDDELPEGWTIAVQAQLGTARPDILCIHRELGFIVFEVKDWRPEAREFKLENKYFKALNTHGGDWYVTEEPVSQVLNYREIIGELFSSLGDTEFMITSVAVLTHYSENHPIFDDLKELIPSKYKQKITKPHMLVVGKESLSRPVSEWIEMITGISRKHVESHRRDKQLPVRTFRHASWLLRVPELATAREEPLQLDVFKKDFILNQKQIKRRRVSGPIGSGKTTLLAACAAKAVHENKRVLVMTFNITLRHWIQLQIKRGAPKDQRHSDFSIKVKRQVELNYLHQWLKSMCVIEGYGFKFQEMIVRGAGYPADDELIAFCNPVLDLIKKRTNGLYDLILLDEFQNFDPRYLPLIEKSLKPDGEMVVFRDSTQDIYSKKHTAITNPMVGYKGQWNRLKDCYRFPGDLLPMLSSFYDRFALQGLDTERPMKDQRAFNEEVKLEWVRSDHEQMSKFGAEQIKSAPSRGYAAADCVFLTRYHDDGLKSLEHLVGQASHEVPGFVHIFHKDKLHQAHLKKAFWPLGGEIKMCTIHSYQGWEAGFLVLCIPPTSDLPQKQDEYSDETFYRLIYVALGRIRKSMFGSTIVVVNAERKLDEFFEDHFEEIFPPGDN